jgi:hypothetical protein
MTKNDLNKLVASLEATSNLENVEVLLKQRERYCLITQALTKKIDRITKQIQRLTSPAKDLLTVTDAIVNPTVAVSEPEEKVSTFAASGLPVDTDVKVVLRWVRRTGNRYQFIFENPENNKRFQVNRPVGPWSTDNARAVIRYTLKHLTGKTVSDSKLAEGMNNLCNVALENKVVIKVYGTQGSLNFQTVGTW